MDFSAPSPASSSSDSHSSYSPHLMTSDLGLDPSDPLNLLLHNTSQLGGNLSTDESSQEGGSPPDWSQLSSLWPEGDLNTQTKPYSDMMDFSELASLSMDMDFSNAIAIEPSALHLNPIKYNIDHNSTHDSQLPYNSDLLTAQFPFTFPSPAEVYSSSDVSSLQSSHSERRLSVTSSASSSGASFSPVPEMAPSPATAKQTEVSVIEANTNDGSNMSLDPAFQLAERVRQSAGVMLALPMSTQLQALENRPNTPSVPVASPATIPKLPIPRLPRPSQSIKSTSSVSSAASTPPPSTPSPPPTTAAATPNISSGPLARPKTSHTTIERRYRTNLNARIQSLRMAVPALRVVEDRDGSKKRAPNKVLVSSDPLKLESVDTNGIVDVIDERGFVDGVKVARKCSKANVLGKAVEYIRVLKKREHRLKAEQAGLKTLISGLVGGPALLREWEREWREMFGGDEKDEVEGEIEAEGDDDDSDDDQDDEEEGGRKRKRGKTSNSAPAAKQEKKEKKPVPGPDGVVSEKRKRGRPRKVVLPAVPPSPPSVAQPDMQVEQGQAPQQYLLAVFALFSFFNSPLTSTSTTHAPSHVHVGKVLNGSVPPADASTTPWGISDYVQILHLIVSVVVLLSFVFSWIGLDITIGGKSKRNRFVLDFTRGAASRNKNLPADWVHLGEDCVLSASTPTSLYTRVQIYHQISSWPGAGAQELATAALVLHGARGVFGGLARLKARAVWAAAKARSAANTYERMVLEMTVDEASKRLSSNGSEAKQHEDVSLPNDDSPRNTPIQVLAVSLIKERIRAHLGVLFVASTRDGSEEDLNGDKEFLEQEERQRLKTIEAAKELGGRVCDMGRSLERVWKLPTIDRFEEEQMVCNEDGESGVDGEVKALLAALVLYRKVFLTVKSGVSSLMSPPPSPGRKDVSHAGMLRRVLGSRVFEESEVLEDARDRAVDLIVELERRNVGLN